MGHTVKLNRDIVHFKDHTLAEEPDAEYIVTITTLMGKGGERNKVRTVGSARHRLLGCACRDCKSLALPKLLSFHIICHPCPPYLLA